VNKIYIDAREMEHPLPLEKGIAAIAALGENDYIYMLNKRNPIPLINLAKVHSLNVLSKEDNDDIWHILISKADKIILESLLNV